MNFFGREVELKELKEKLASNKSEAVLVYGRRRVGKSELIKEALRQSKIKHISFVCRQDLFQENLRSFSEEVSAAFNEGYLSFSNLGNLLQYLFAKAKKERIALFIDEYPFLRGNNRAIDSYFQIAIDKFRLSSKLKIILCGSYIDTMKSLIDADAPLFGRFTSVINLPPFDYFDTSKFFPNISNEKKFEFYSCFGGVPFYLNLIEPTKSLRKNLENILLPSNSILENEITIQLNQEIAKIENLNYVLGAIGGGVHSYKDLNSGSDNSNDRTHGWLLHSLKKLMGMGLLEKSSPINEPENHKKSSYYIADNLLDFYYTFLYKKANARSISNASSFFDQHIKDGLENFYLPRKFESVAKEYLIRMNKADKLKPPITSIGRYVYHDKALQKNGEFDVATKDARGWTCYECKYLSKKVEPAIIRRAMERANELSLDFYRYGFFSRKGFAPFAKQKNVTLYTLDDIYKV